MGKGWVFLAQVKFSLTQNTAQDITPATPSLCNSTNQKLIGDDDKEKMLVDNVLEEGVEVVELAPFLGPNHGAAESDTSLQLEKGSDNVSVLYVEGTKKTVNETLTQPGTDHTINSKHGAKFDGDITLDAVKRIRFNKALLSEID